jgi:hypothetical protein
VIVLVGRRGTLGNGGHTSYGAQNRRMWGSAWALLRAGEPSAQSSRLSPILAKPNFRGITSNIDNVGRGDGAVKRTGWDPEVVFQQRRIRRPRSGNAVMNVPAAEGGGRRPPSRGSGVPVSSAAAPTASIRNSARAAGSFHKGRQSSRLGQVRLAPGTLGGCLGLDDLSVAERLSFAGRVHRNWSRWLRAFRRGRQLQHRRSETCGHI